MTWYLSDPLTKRTWVIPLPGRNPLRSSSLADAVDGRKILITGASSGIGRAVATKVAASGGEVLLVARSEDALKEVATEIADEGGNAHVIPADLSQTESIEALVGRVVDEHGGVDALVNNAGHSIRRAVKRSVDRTHDYERLMRLNYHGALELTLGLLPGMRERGRGHVVMVSTMGVQFGAPRFSGYVASKAALDAFTRVCAAELRTEGVDFTTIHMPLVRTPMIAPTEFYDGAPALSPGQAAGWVTEALRVRPRTVDYPIGPLGEAAYALAPGLIDRAMSRYFRLAGDSRAAKGELTEDDAHRDGDEHHDHYAGGADDHA